MNDPTMLARTANRLSDLPGSLAFELERYRRFTGRNPAEEFCLPEASLVPLSVCRKPRRDRFAADVELIGNRLGVQEAALANFLRTADAVATLIERHHIDLDVSAPRGVLAAARDHGEEHTAFEEPLGREPMLPGWLRAAVDRFWGEAERPSSFPRNLELPVLTRLPLAIIEIDHLTVGALDHWMRLHRLSEIMAIADRPLRGCLTAYAGIGLIFVDGSDGPPQRRLTLAHEAAHFVVDYLLPREEVAQRRPELLDVLDGERAPSDTERFDALLSDIPTGFHTHLVERDAYGGHLSSSSAEGEDRAERLVLELLAPVEQVLGEVSHWGTGDVQTVLREKFGLPAGASVRYANYLRRQRPRRSANLLDAIGLGPDDQSGVQS